jgi:hypothetical protein
MSELSWTARAPFQTRWEADRLLGFGLCQAPTKTGKPCTKYAVGAHKRCRRHRGGRR